MKVLILHASLGAGHRRAAEALQEAFRQQKLEAEVQDLLDFLPGPLKWFYPWSYDFMIEDARWIWRIVYKASSLPKSPYSPATAATQKWQFNKLKQYLSQNGFTHIIGTHFTPCALLTDWRRQDVVRGRIYSVITDYTAHRCWLRKGLDEYFVATQSVASELKSAGFSESSITVSGIPVSLSFSRRLSTEEARKLWGIGFEQKAFLVLTSGLNLGTARVLIQDLRQMEGSYRFLVSAGKEGERVKRIQELCKDDQRFTVFGFSPKISEMMSAADLVISKPGGLIVSESLAMGIPQLLFSPIPGQEEANAQYLVKENAAVTVVAKSGEFRGMIETLLREPDRLSAMSKAAVRLGHPDAARKIVHKILGDIKIS